MKELSLYYLTLLLSFSLDSIFFSNYLKCYKIRLLVLAFTEMHFSSALLIFQISHEYKVMHDTHLVDMPAFSSTASLSLFGGVQYTLPGVGCINDPFSM